MQDIGRSKAYCSGSQTNGIALGKPFNREGVQTGCSAVPLPIFLTPPRALARNPQDDTQPALLVLP